MSTENQPPPEAPDVPPAPFLLAGLALLGVAFFWNGSAPAARPEMRAATIAAGLLTIGFVLWRVVPWMLRREEMRVAVAGLWGLGAVACVLACYGLGPGWGSLAVLFALLGGASALAALLTLVTPWWRYALIGLLLVFHFSAVLCAVATVPPPGEAPPFLSHQAYVYLFHDYLIALNVNTGYRFDAPEPPPSSLAWFRVQWQDGASRWLRIPDHEKAHDHLERRRFLALASVLAQAEPYSSLPPSLASALARRRRGASVGKGRPIPMAPTTPVAEQFRRPTPTARLLLSSCARHVARTARHPEEGGAAVQEVKAYCVEFRPPPVEHFQAGRDPTDAGLYHVYFMGAYSPMGDLLTKLRWETRPDGEVVVHGDECLYWRLPIMPAEDAAREPPEPGATPPVPPRGAGKWDNRPRRYINFARVHAGDSDEESIP